MKYTTEEERKQAKREYDKQRYQANKEKILEQKRQYHQANKEKRAEYYQTNKEKFAEYYQTNKEKIAEYYQTNKEKFAEHQKQYRKTPMGRALYLVNRHNYNDKKMGRGECSLTALWVHNYIFSQKCIYCGEDDWTKLGCDRKDNSLPHTPSNVVPCCEACNKKRHLKPFEAFVAECNAQERLKEWEEFLTLMTK